MRLSQWRRPKSCLPFDSPPSFTVNLIHTVPWTSSTTPTPLQPNPSVIAASPMTSSSASLVAPKCSLKWRSSSTKCVLKFLASPPKSPSSAPSFHSTAVPACQMLRFTLTMTFLLMDAGGRRSHTTPFLPPSSAAASSI